MIVIRSPVSLCARDILADPADQTGQRDAARPALTDFQLAQLRLNQDCVALSVHPNPGFNQLVHPFLIPCDPLANLVGFLLVEFAPLWLTPYTLPSKLSQEAVRCQLGYCHTGI